MPLVIVQVGRRVRFVSVEACHGLQSRLAAMGLVPGVEIEVLGNSPHGPFLIAVKGSRIMLGRGMAQKIVIA
jgi:ferrous iron transport protein A